MQITIQHQVVSSLILITIQKQLVLKQFIYAVILIQHARILKMYHIHQQDQVLVETKDITIEVIMMDSVLTIMLNLVFIYTLLLNLNKQHKLANGKLPEYMIQ